ncbi:MAG TPA: DsbA family protein, partial [Kofleriaceae bacterium]|nr:DsbA family protein [Kofleriaceae bacterium]
MRVEFYFDFSCPFAHVAQAQIEELAARTGAELVWCPMLLGGVMRALGSDQVTAAESEAKKRHHVIDRLRWAELRGLPMAPVPHHPQKSVRALRAVLAVPEARRPGLIHALFDAYWARGERLEDTATIARALDLAGVTGAAAATALAANDDPAMKQELVRRTDEAIARGVFGAPTFLVTGPDGRER